MFHIPLDLSAQTIMRRYGLLGVREAYGHLHYFTRDTALRAREDAGHRVIDWFYTRRGIEEPATQLGRRPARVPRRMGFALHPDVTVRVLGGFSLLALTTGEG